MRATQLVFTSFMVFGPELFAQSGDGYVASTPGIDWGQVIGGPGNDTLYAMQHTSDGGYMLGGSSGSGIGGYKTANARGLNDYWIVKLSAIGKKEWDMTYGSNDTDNLTSLMQTSDGGYILGGTSRSNAGREKSADNKGGYNADGILNTDYWIIKVSANGMKVWDKTFGGMGQDGLTSIIQTADGGYILGGTSDSGGGLDKSRSSQSSDFWVIKLDAAGLKQWDKTFGGSAADSLSIVRQTADGGYILGGNTQSSAGNDMSTGTKGGSDYWIVKISSSGEKLWDKTFGGTGQDRLRSLDVTTDNGYILGGSSNTNANGDKSGTSENGMTDYWILKLNASGSKEWDRTFGGVTYLQNNVYTGSSFLESVRQTSDGGYFLGGRSSGKRGRSKSRSSNYGEEVWVIKLSPKGNRLWDNSIFGWVTDTHLAIDETSDGSYVVARTLSQRGGFPYNGGQDFSILKLYAKLDFGRFGYVAGKSTFDFTSKSGVVSSPQSAYFSVPASVEQLTILKSEGSDWLNAKLIDNHEITFSINSKGLASGNYRANVFLISPNNERGTYSFWLTVENEDVAGTEIRINAGGSAVTTSNGKQFSADRYFTGTNRTSSMATGDILNTVDDDLYRSGRCTPDFNYNIPVNNGLFNVVLQFAETWYGAPSGTAGGAGKRQFHIDMEGSRVLTNFDIYAAAGGAMKTVQKTFSVMVTDGMLNINFVKGLADLPRVSAIEVLPSGSVLSPVADAAVDFRSKSANYGSETYLDVKNINNYAFGSRNSYLRFSLPQAGEVSSAKLRVYGRKHENDKEIYLHAFGIDDDSWSENFITSVNAPVASTPKLGFVPVSNMFQYYEIDVTGYVKEQQQAGDALVSFLLTDSSNRNTRLVFNSRENLANPPQLIMKIVSAANPAARAGTENASLLSGEADGQSFISPNPVTGQFNLLLSDKHTGNVDLKIINSAGQDYEIKTTKQPAAGSKIHVDVSELSLAPGIYMLRVASEKTTEIVKLILAE
ncbi:CBM96 family carbohydrate-binding protein [Dyadobacter flavalbus]|uniref:CBM96 family carbohydrate-binding protein n=1 Tax=Dyadobacter flavalbus TaxID=2579942 RepID=UPI001375D71B|nr:malectin domain-containing carbohydrate-binding protein [Dyadobacter flavalbus]